MAAARGGRAGKRGRKERTPPPGEVTGAALEPIGEVERELTRPDGTRIKVKVPVYPPFRLADRPTPTAAKAREQGPKQKAS